MSTRRDEELTAFDETWGRSAGFDGRRRDLGRACGWLPTPLEALEALGEGCSTSEALRASEAWAQGGYSFGGCSGHQRLGGE